MQEHLQMNDAHITYTRLHVHKACSSTSRTRSQSSDWGNGFSTQGTGSPPPFPQCRLGPTEPLLAGIRFEFVVVHHPCLPVIVELNFIVQWAELLEYQIRPPLSDFSID